MYILFDLVLYAKAGRQAGTVLQSIDQTARQCTHINYSAVCGDGGASVAADTPLLLLLSKYILQYNNNNKVEKLIIIIRVSVSIHPFNRSRRITFGCFRIITHKQQQQ